MTDSTEVDVVVLGLGPGGEHAAAELAKAGLEVVGVDRRLVGGECPYFGCIPSKMMVRAAFALAEAGRVARLAGSARVSPDFAPVARRIREEATDDWDDKVAVERLEKAGARFVRGTGRMTGPRTVRVDTADGPVELTARRGVVLNTGTEPAVPPIDGLADTPYWTNRDAVRVTTLPESLVVLGGGAIGCELAQAFARFGSEVILLEATDEILGREDRDAAAIVEAALRRDGVEIDRRAEVASVRAEGDEKVMTCTRDGRTRESRVDAILVAVGRAPNVEGLGLEAAGVGYDDKGVAVDDRLRTSNRRIFAAGDVASRFKFTHTADALARIAIRNALFLGRAKASALTVPW
jgi:pyruvate/2-oxoglutarate dehydrogenase complex dihydrolipoamide dehydrogenase (E3) component